MLKVGEAAPKFEFLGMDGKKVNFPVDFKGKWLGLIFLRHLGCSLCMEKISEIKTNQQKYLDQGMEIMVVVQSTEKRVQGYVQKKGIKFNVIPDHERRIYELYEVAKGGVAAFLAPAVMVATIRATLKGNFHGPFEGDELQKPASFIIGPDGKLVFMEYGRNIADVIKEADFLQTFAKLKTQKGK